MNRAIITLLFATIAVSNLEAKTPATRALTSQEAAVSGLRAIARPVDDRCPFVFTERLFLPTSRGGPCFFLVDVYEDCNGSVMYVAAGFACA